uniref:NADH-ubiquinone oxidoreductase chain 4 n=1 Tax=Remiarctus bertholdii TaxID=1104393 RepID=A0A411ATU8_9EUCA|nr:NADH dehydrogenase subunit 4 [Remiarctus bertholdii]QAX91420.1 NADH dehydrogenase subunit 4 [Remiarctus bertholdii]
MLKYILSLGLLIQIKNRWEVIQFFIFFMSFLFGIMSNHYFLISDLGSMMGYDFTSYILILLSMWVMGLVVMSSYKIKFMNNFSSLFLVVNILLLIMLIITFSAMDYLLFYISFESSLIPTLILILGWGYQPERVEAGIYMLFYTLFASLPLLVSLLSIYNSGMSLTLNVVESVEIHSLVGVVWYFATVFAFIVKLPMYMFHLWLPKAHVEAPVAGSMILAGVLLKLGGYGLIRVLPLFSEVNKLYSGLWMSVAILGGFIVSLMCLRQVDIKSLIAYSSVAHMGLVLCGLVVFGWWGLNGAVVVMVGHGLCSSGLFCLANMVYERIGSRSLLISKGLLSFMPSMGLWWFLLSIGNMAAPPTLNLLGEINLIMSVVSWSSLTMVGISLLSFFSAAYTLYMYSLSQHGVFYNSVYSVCSGKIREYLVLFLHWFPLNILILKGGMLIPMY